MRRFLLTFTCVLVGGEAAAQPVAGVVEGAGVKVGEGTVIHPIVGVESGIVHNVFYEDTGPVTSGVMRVLASLAAGALPDERLQAPAEQPLDTRTFGDFAWRLEGSALYTEYLSGNDNVVAQRNFQLGALARGIVFPKRTWQFAFVEDFQRMARPLNFESNDQAVRDINRLALELNFKPQGRTISAGVGYSNVIDYFEDENQKFANRFNHTIGANVKWQVLPVTRIYGDVSYGFFRPLGSESTRVPSNPLRTNIGIATALTVKTNVNARVGFGWSDYETGADFLNITGAAQLGYRFSPQARLGLMYEYDFADSINANFYRDHAAKARLDWYHGRFAASVAADFRFRLYRGVIQEVMMPTATDRNDVIISTPVTASYNFRNWIALTLDYQFLTDQTDFRYSTGGTDPVFDDPSFTRHSILAGVRAAY